MSNWRKFINILVIVTMLVTSISAISFAKTVVEVWANPSMSPVSPTVVGWGFKYALERFKELYPDIELKWNVQVAGAGQTPEAMQKLMTAVAAGTVPDVTTLDRFLLAEWAAKGAIQPIDEYAKGSKIVVPANCPPAAWDELHGLDGKLYGTTNLGDNTGFWSLFYNKTLFREAGLDPNKPPKTWSQWIEYAKKLTKTDASGRIIQLGYRPYPDWAGEFNGVARTNQATLVTPDGKTVTINSPKCVESLEQIVKLIDAQGGIDKVSRFLSGIQPGALEPFLNNKIGMYDMGEWFLWDIAQYAPKLDFGVTFLPTPTGKQFTAWIGGWAWAMPKGCKHPEEAFKVMEFLMSRDFAEAFIKGSQAYAKEMKRLVVLPGALYFVHTDLANKYNLPTLIKDTPNVYKALRHFMIAKDTAYKVYYREKNLAAAELWAAEGRATESAIYHRQTPKQALDEQNAKVQVELDKFYK